MLQGHLQLIVYNYTVYIKIVYIYKSNVIFTTFYIVNIYTKP